MHPTQTQYFLFPVWIIAAAVVLAFAVIGVIVAVIVAASSRRRDLLDEVDPSG